MDVPAPAEARRDHFTRFVNRAIKQAQQSRGWSIPRIAMESGIGVNTLYRWTRGEWADFPKGELVEAFCDTLDIPVDAAFMILWPGKTGRPAEPSPLSVDANLEILARRLMDPNFPEAEKYLIRETIASLASRNPRGYPKAV